MPRHIGAGGDWFPNLMRIGINNGTVFHRAAFLKTIDWQKILSWHLLSCDYVTNVFMAAQGKVGFIDEEMGVWRRGGNTVSSPTQIDKIVRYIDHECRQGLHLAEEFPNTPYGNFTQKQAELHRKYQLKDCAVSMKRYDVLSLIEWNEQYPCPWWAKNKVAFYIYVYSLKKLRTLIQIIQNKL